MKKGKVFVLSVVMASLIGILLSSGVVAGNGECCNCNCEVERDGVSYGVYAPSQEICENHLGGGSYLLVVDHLFLGNCCAPGAEGGDCWCVWTPYCDEIGGMSVEYCEFLENEPCKDLITDDCKCVPEASTIALLATGLIGMVGYFRLRRKEE